jgi:hypothetical protein
MNDKDRKKLGALKKMQPSFGVFEKMAQLLKGVQENTDKLRKTSDNILMEASETTRD